MEDNKAECRNCGKILIGKPYHLGGGAYFPDTIKSCPVNYYGGYVCSESCDRAILKDMNGSFPGAGKFVSFNSGESQSLRNNWC